MSNSVKLLCPLHFSQGSTNTAGGHGPGQLQFEIPANMFSFCNLTGKKIKPVVEFNQTPFKYNFDVPVLFKLFSFNVNLYFYSTPL